MNNIAIKILLVAMLIISSCTKSKNISKNEEEKKIIVKRDSLKYIDNPISLRYDSIKDFSEGLAVVVKDGKYGVMNVVGKEVVACQYDFIHSFSSGLAKTELDYKIGFVAKDGTVLVTPKYEKPGIYDNAYHLGFFNFYNGMIGVKSEGKWGFIDNNGKEVIKCKYDYAEVFTDEITSAKRNGRWYVIDKKGNEVKLLSKYSRVSGFFNGIAEVITNCGISYGYHENDIYSKSPKCGYINKFGKEIIPSIYDYECYYDGYDLGDVDFSEEMVLVQLNKKFGFINKDGKKITALKYKEAESFSEGLAAVKINDKWGFIDKTGKELISLKYDRIESFNNGVAKVQLNKKWGVINKCGKLVIPFLYEEVDDIPFTDQLI